MKSRRAAQTFSGEYGRLEDLLRFDEQRSVVTPEPRKHWLWGPLLVAGGIVVGVEVVARMAGFDPPFFVVLFVVVGAVALRLVARLVAEPAGRRTGELIRMPGGPTRIQPGTWYEGGDGMAEAIRRWDRRLEWGATSPERYNHTVCPRLGELADSCLRQRYGLTRATDPARARALLGEQVWATLHPPAGHNPTAGDLANALRRLERV